MIKKLTNRIDPRMKRIQKNFGRLAKEAYGEFKKVTPIKSGNAKRNTNFNNKDTISGDYNYANRLNAGYSKQAKDGMTEPTIDFIKDEVSKILR